MTREQANKILLSSSISFDKIMEHMSIVNRLEREHIIEDYMETIFDNN